MDDSVIIEILKNAGKVSLADGTLDPALDLFEHGLTSFNSVQVMLTIEEKLGIYFPDDLIRRETFQSLGNLKAALQRINADNL